MYQLQQMGGDRAIAILDDLLSQLADVPVELLTTFELNLIRRIAANAPADLPTVGVEARGND